MTTTYDVGAQERDHGLLGDELGELDVLVVILLLLLILVLVLRVGLLKLGVLDRHDRALVPGDLGPELARNVSAQAR